MAREGCIPPLLFAAPNPARRYGGALLGRRGKKREGRRGEGMAREGCIPPLLFYSLTTGDY